MKRPVLALLAIGAIAGLSACGGSPAPATNSQAYAAGYRYGDKMGALSGYIESLGASTKVTTASLKTYCQIAEVLKGGMPRKWMGHGAVSVKLASEWQLGCGSGLGAEAAANTP